MVDYALIAAVRNAVERGETVGKAKQTLINAGYSKQEVEDAATQVIQLKEEGRVIQPSANGSVEAAPQAPQSQQEPQRQSLIKGMGKKKVRLILLIIILALVALGIGAFLLIKFIL